jgi:hypothetical protein
VPPLLLPLLLPAVPLLLPAVPLLLPLLLPAVPLLLPLLLPAVPLLLPLLLAVPLLLPLLPLALASSPVAGPALVLPPHAGANTAKPPTDMETRKRTLIALIEEPPQCAPFSAAYSPGGLGLVSGRSRAGGRVEHPRSTRLLLGHYRSVRRLQFRRTNSVDSTRRTGFARHGSSGFEPLA